MQQQNTGFGQAAPASNTGGGLFGGGSMGGSTGNQGGGFGGAFGAPAGQQNTGGGLFSQGQTGQQNQNTGGLFGNKQPQQTQGTGLFGGSSNTFGNSSTPNMTQQQPTGGLFGNSQQQFGQAGQQPQDQKPSGLFGAAPQNQGAGFGGGSSLFGGAAQSNQAAAPASSGFGAQPTGGAFGMTQQNSTFGGQPGGTGLFGGAGQQTQNQGQGQGQGPYPNPQKVRQQVTTRGTNFTNKCVVVPDTSGKPCPNLYFHSIRAEEGFEAPSIQMIHFYDMMAQANRQQENFEFKAMSEFSQNPNNYRMLQKLQALQQKNNTGAAAPAQGGGFGQPQNNNQQTGLNRQVSTGIGGGTGLFGGAGQTQNTFGQPQQNAGSGLFGANQNQQNQTPASGGLFGQNQAAPGQQAPSQGGLFGAPAQPQLTTQPSTGGGLFGAPAQQQQNSFGGGSAFGAPQKQQSTLFGGTTNSTPGAFGATTAKPATSVFGAPAQPATGGGGLFGGAAPNQSASGGGLFGNPSAPGGGLQIGKTTSTTAQPGSLFGGGMAKQPTANPIGGSLFGGGGAPNTSAQTGGLFGAKPATTSMFGAQGVPQTGGGLFGASSATPAPAPGGSLFGAAPQTGAPTMGGAFASFQATPAPAPMGMTPGVQQQIPGAMQDQMQQYLTSLRQQNPYGLSALENTGDVEKNTEKELENLKKLASSKQEISQSKFYLTDHLKQNPYGSSTSGGDDDTSNDALIAQLLNQQAQDNMQEEDARQKKKAAGLGDAYYQQQLSMLKQKSINSKTNNKPQYKFRDLSAPTNANIFKNPSDSNSQAPDSARLPFHQLARHDSQASKQPEQDSQKNDIKEGSKFQIKFDKEPASESSVAAQNKPSDNEMPREPKKGYTIFPPFSQLIKMSRQDLQQVEGLMVSNKFGSIEFIGKVDILGVDFADVVTIEQKTAEVYNDTHKAEGVYPNQGEKLNIPALITLNGFEPKRNQTEDQFVAKLTKFITKSGGEHIFYDKHNSEWQFKVQHFTKYGAPTDSDSEDDQMDNQDDNDGIQMIDSCMQKQASAPVSGNMADENSLIASPSCDENATLRTGPQHQMVVQENRSAATSVMFPNKTHNFSGMHDNCPLGISQDVVNQKQFKGFPAPDTAPQIYARTELNAPQQEIKSPFLSRPKSQVNQVPEVSRILKKIEEREQTINACTPLVKLPSNKEADDIFKNLLNLGRQKPKSTSGQVRCARPCFNPRTGQLVTTSYNKVHVKNIRVQKSEPSEPTSAVHSSITIYRADSELNNQMERMEIDNESDDQMINAEENQSRASNQQQQPPRPGHVGLSDSFFARLFRGQCLPQGTMFGPQSKSAVKLAKFLLALAEELIQNIKKVDQNSKQFEILKQEFFVVCLMNALWGNPHIHLWQLFTSVNAASQGLTQEVQDLQRSINLFGSTDIDASEPPVFVERKRRNAVTEFLRFYCRTQFKVDEPQQTDVSIYQACFKHLSNGSVKETVRLLNKHQKRKLALFVAQSINAQTNMSKLKLHAQQFALQNGTENIVKLITGEIQRANFGAQYKWEQDLLSQLLFSNDPTKPFTQIIQNKVQNDASFQQQNSIFLTLLKVYSGQGLRDAELTKFSNNFLPEHNSKDFKMRWLIQLIVRQAFANSDQNNQCPPILPADFVSTSSKYVYQLLAQGQWRMALLVCQLLPTDNYRHQNIRRRMTFEVIQNQVTEILTNGKFKAENRRHLLEKLLLPESWLQSSIALYAQHYGLHRCSISHWMNDSLMNSSQAHNLFYKNVLTEFVGKSANKVTLLKALQHGHEIGQNTRAHLVEVQGLCKGVSQINDLVQKLDANKNQIYNWETETNMFKRFCNVIEQLKTFSSFHGQESEAVSQLLREIVSMRQLVNQAEPSIVKDFVQRELVPIEAYLKTKQVMNRSVPASEGLMDEQTLMLLQEKNLEQAQRLSQIQAQVSIML